MRTFNSGATRDDNKNKLEYARFLSPIVLKQYCEYLHKHRKQADDNIRDPDNWKKGIPVDTYMDSKFRHFMDTWLINQGFDKLAIESNIEDVLCAELFNTMGYLHEILAAKYKADNIYAVSARNKMNKVYRNRLADLIDPVAWTPKPQLASLIDTNKWKPYFSACTIYVSHPICGSKGNNATQKDVEENCRKAVDFGRILKDRHPTINWYIPGEVDLVVQGLLFSKQVTTEAVMQADLEILKTCDGLLAMGHNESDGVKREVNYADDNDIPNVSCNKFELPIPESIIKLVKEAKENYEERRP